MTAGRWSPWNNVQASAIHPASTPSATLHRAGERPATASGKPGQAGPTSAGGGGGPLAAAPATAGVAAVAAPQSKTGPAVRVRFIS